MLEVVHTELFGPEAGQSQLLRLGDALIQGQIRQVCRRLLDPLGLGELQLGPTLGVDGLGPALGTGLDLWSEGFRSHTLSVP